jgi:hypothetical protein
MGDVLMGEIQDNKGESAIPTGPRAETDLAIGD